MIAAFEFVTQHVRGGRLDLHAVRLDRVGRDLIKL